jgi:hypothetical protein
MDGNIANLPVSDAIASGLSFGLGFRFFGKGINRIAIAKEGRGPLGSGLPASALGRMAIARMVIAIPFLIFGRREF